MLTGDNERTASAIAKVAGVDRVVAGVKTDGKEGNNTNREDKPQMRSHHLQLEM